MGNHLRPNNIVAAIRVGRHTGEVVIRLFLYSSRKKRNEKRGFKECSVKEKFRRLNITSQKNQSGQPGLRGTGRFRFVNIRPVTSVRLALCQRRLRWNPLRLRCPVLPCCCSGWLCGSSTA